MEKDVEQLVENLEMLARISMRPKYDVNLKELLGTLVQVVALQHEGGLTEDVKQAVISATLAKLENSIETNMPDGHGFSISNGQNKEWLGKREKEISWNYWDRYETYISAIKKLPVKVVSALSRSTKEILSELPNPISPGKFDCRGLVVGDVQSGKTANYAGLLCRAIDAGYRIIVVLAGGTDNLRSQTQDRLEQDVIGHTTNQNNTNTGKNRYGVGGVKPNISPHICSGTTVEEDFRDKFAARYENLDGNIVLFYVVKKNASVLAKLLKYFKLYKKQDPEALRNAPFLLIDDEADYASVNAAAHSDDNPTKINRQIRSLLSDDLFLKKAYVGYTATPYANIFINPDIKDEDFRDLFPRDFIYCLNVSEQYIGPAQLFLKEEVNDDSEPQPQKLNVSHAVQIVPEEPEFSKRMKTPNLVSPAELPDSLDEALVSYMLAHAVIRQRKLKMNCTSMLVHVRRETAGHAPLEQALRARFAEYKNELISYSDGKSDDSPLHPLLNKIKDVWNKQFYNALNQNESWSSIRNMLSKEDFLNEFRFFHVNGTPNGKNLDYSQYENQKLAAVIVGGDILARGLTIKGLVTTYFLRVARQYDTLLQMGRWFGYRNGYEDVCRIFMPLLLKLFFEHITVATEELKQQILSMRDRNMTPEQFGLCVRESPGGLLITARNKMRAAQRGVSQRLSFHDSFLGTSIVAVDEESRNANNEWFLGFISKIDQLEGMSVMQRNDAIVWPDVPSSMVIDFINGMKNQTIYKAVDRQVYQSNQIEQLLLREGTIDVSLPILRRGVDGVSKLSVPVRGEVKEFAIPVRNPEGDVRVLRFPRNNATALTDERGRLTDEQIKEWAANKGKDPNHLTRSDYRTCRAAAPETNHPLLLLAMFYVPERPVLEPGTFNTRPAKTIESKDFVKLISSCAISFPNGAGSDDRNVLYTCNAIMMEQLLQDERNDSEQD